MITIGAISYCASTPRVNFDTLTVAQIFARLTAGAARQTKIERTAIL